MPSVKGAIKKYFLIPYRICLLFASRHIDRELTRRNSNRGQGSSRWLVPEEIPVAVALANVIVPSDEETPGLSDIDVLGPSVVDILDKLIHKNRDRQDSYARGLYSFDLWALQKSGCHFAAMTENDQVTLLQETQQYSEKLRGGSRLIRTLRMLGGIVQVANGRLFAARLYPQLRNDCLQIFYTSRVSWVWLEYDGPPMDKGYLQLQRRC